MSLVCGIDYSTHAVDVVWLDEDTDRAEWRRYGLKYDRGQDAFDRTRNVRAIFPSPTHSAWDDVTAIGIEEPRGYNAGALYRVQGAILACLPRQVLVQPWLPGEWRKAVGLPGNANKQDVWEFVVQAVAGPTGGFAWPQDACDAYCIALATRNALQKEEAA